MNPVRVGYFRNILFHELNINPWGKTALEVGCGGGILCEEIAKMGFDTIGIDPSAHSLAIAQDHAQDGGLEITYEEGFGESLPYPDTCCDAVFCCDVLEHVDDPGQVISEIGRVLKPGGIFCYDTINRTFMSKLIAINIAQKWKWWAFMPPNLHVWDMFITPAEMKKLLKQNDFDWREHRGTKPNENYVTVLGHLHKRAMGTWTYQDLSEKLFMVESRNMDIMYMGYAVKN